LVQQTAHDDDNESWHFGRAESDEQPEGNEVSASDALAEDTAVMVIVFSAFVAPDAMSAALPPIDFASETVDPLLAVVVILIFKNSACVNEADHQVEHYLADQHVLCQGLHEVSHY
jgi:hypothetical protein